mgnify:CR=1 FL=1
MLTIPSTYIPTHFSTLSLSHRPFYFLTFQQPSNQTEYGTLVAMVGEFIRSYSGFTYNVVTTQNFKSSQLQLVICGEKRGNN